jgi:hypothetical protein
MEYVNTDISLPRIHSRYLKIMNQMLDCCVNLLKLRKAESCLKITDVIHSSGKVSHLNSGDAGFKPRTKQCMRFTIFFLSPSKETLSQFLELDHDCLNSFPIRYSISFNAMTSYRLPQGKGQYSGKSQYRSF